MPESATGHAVLYSSAQRCVGQSAERGLPLRLGVLTEQIPPALVDDVVSDAGAQQRRLRLLPARTVV